MINLKDFSNISWFNWGNTIQTSETADYSIFMFNFNILDNKVNYATRQLDYYDLYKFVGSVDSMDSYRVAYAKLANNRALAVVDNFDKFKAGDIILKNDFGEPIHIPTKQAGIFIPTYYEFTNGKLIITNTIYSNINEIPTISQEHQHYTENGYIYYDDEKKTQLTLPVLDGDYIYTDYVVGPLEYVITLKTHNSKLIYPVIKFYDTQGEEVYCDIVTRSSNTLIANVPDGLTMVVR